MPMNMLDIGKAYGDAERIKTMRNRNALADFAMEKEAGFNALAPQIAQGDEAARQEAMAIDPERAQSGWDAYSKEENKARVTVARLLKHVFDQEPENRPAVYRQARAVAEKTPGINMDNVPEEYDEQALRVFYAGATDPKALKGQSPIGKLEMDRRAGILTPEQTAAGVAKANAPRGPVVQITNQGDTIDDKLLDMDLKTIEGTAAAVKAGADFKPRLEVIVQGLESGNVETGRWQEATLPIRQWAQSAGWYNDPNMDQQEAVLAAISYMIPRMRVVGSGQTSDVEIALFSKATAQYSNTPGGNILIARGMLQLQKRNEKLEAAQRRFVRENKTLEGFDADTEIGPLFPKVTEQADADKLDAGTVFIYAPNGRFMVKQ